MRARRRFLHASVIASVFTPTSGYHVPVLAAEAVEWLITNPAGTYVDGTLGGGGHSAALLEVLAPAGGHLIGVDRDPDALNAAEKRLLPHVSAGSAKLVRSNFGALPDILKTVSFGALGGGSADGMLDGILLDLGVSSHQIDEAARGFSYMQDGPLDMRMDQAGFASGSLTAETILNEWDSDAIANVLFEYGDERDSRRLARAIVAARPLKTTLELCEVLKAAGKKKEPKEVLKRNSRVFQALRIEVNQEMVELERALTAAATLIRPGGRLAVMSYHSLEDRRVKRVLRSGTFNNIPPPQDVYGNVLSPWKPLTRQPVLPTDEEQAENRRSRSVRLRVGERTEYPALG